MLHLSILMSMSFSIHSANLHPMLTLDPASNPIQIAGAPASDPGRDITDDPHGPDPHGDDAHGENHDNGMPANSQKLPANQQRDWPNPPK